MTNARIRLVLNLAGSQGAVVMTETNLAEIYNAYISCLNRQDWPNLGTFVQEDVHYNGKQIGLTGYRGLLENDFVEIPDLYFNIELLVSDQSYVAARLLFNVTPKGSFFGLPINGRKVSFSENVFYQFRDGKISLVWSVIDKAAIEAQI